MSKNVPSPNQPDLFASLAEPVLGNNPQPLSPSEAFKTAHPDFVEPTPAERIVDAAHRRVAERSANVGGGIAALYRGELETDQVAPNKEKVDDIEVPTSRLKSSDAALQHRIARDTRMRGLSKVREIKQNQGRE